MPQDKFQRKPEKKYTVKQLAELAGVTTRTLRYYDEIGLLPPAETAANGYRLYGETQLRRLQQILFYCALDTPRQEILPLLNAPPEAQQKQLQAQLGRIEAEEKRLNALSRNLRKAISELKGECTMTEQERFEGMKRDVVEANEKKYGKEIRETYGEKAVDVSNAKMKGMSREQWQRMQALNEEIAALLKKLVPEGDPACAEAMHLAELHKQWLCCSWPDGLYTPESHIGLAQMYRADERFAAYYDKIIPGATDYLCTAIENYCNS